MLVLSRKRNESIVINEDIRITVIDVRGDTVRLGFEAPKEVLIDREEVYKQKKKKVREGTDVCNHGFEKGKCPSSNCRYWKGLVPWIGEPTDAG